jgi:cytochrome oxidase Cu insertion factor (SCO1/SenC/PrrC family)
VTASLAGLLAACTTAAPAARVEAEPNRENRQARMEAHFPNTALVSHRGEHVRFYDDLVRGKCVLIQFMYTSCDGT